MKKVLLVAVAVVLLIAGFALATFAVKSQEAKEAENRVAQRESMLVREHSPRLGSVDAEVTIVEFFDPACEACRAFHPIVKGMMRDHPGKISLVMRHMPLHAGSDEVVKILEAARLQGKYWESLEAAYSNQQRWAINHRAHADLFWQAVAPVGLDPEQVSLDMRSAAVAENVRLDIADGQALGVDKTPGFFVNGRPLVVFGERQLRELVQSELDRHGEP